MTKKEIVLIENRIIELDNRYDECCLLADSIINLDGIGKDRDIANRLLGDYRGENHAIFEQLQFLKSLVR